MRCGMITRSAKETRQQKEHEYGGRELKKGSKKYKGFFIKRGWEPSANYADFQ